MAVDPPILLTERLELRAPVASDFAASVAIVSQPEAARFFGPQTSTADQFLRFCRGAGSWLLYDYGLFVIRMREDEQVIGTCGIFHTWRDLGPDFDDEPEAGWMLTKESRGKGLAGEAMGAVLGWFDRTHGPRRVVCMIDPANAPSIKLADKLGFASLREGELPDGTTLRLFERPPAGC